MKKRNELNMLFKWPYPAIDRQDEYILTLNSVELFKGASYHVARLLINIYTRVAEGSDNGPSS